MGVGEIPVEVSAEPKRRSGFSDFMVRLVKEKPLGTVGAVITIAALFVGIFADLSWLEWFLKAIGFANVNLEGWGIAPYGFNEIHLGSRLEPSSAQFLLGTDNVGRDVLSRVIFGARISMVVGLGGSLVALIVGWIIGLPSGYFGGKLDMVLQRFVDAFMCFPPLFLYLFIMAVFEPGITQVILVLGVVRGIGGSRVTRGYIMTLKQNTYVEAARAIGSTPFRIMWRNLLPQIIPLTIVGLTSSVGYMILAEATLSFLGLGIPPPEPSWGGMLSGEGRRYMLQAPWMALWPGLALAVVVYGFNMFGDAIRDLLDPRLRGGLGRYGGARMKKIKAKLLETKAGG